MLAATCGVGSLTTCDLPGRGSWMNDFPRKTVCEWMRNSEQFTDQQDMEALGFIRVRLASIIGSS